MLSETLSEEAEQQEENQGCNIFETKVEGEQAVVSFETTKDATLVVGIYSEDGEQMEASGIAEVTPDETEVTVELAGDKMPEYFLVRTFLIDSGDYSPLCPADESTMYTEEMQKLLDSTTDDYDADRVLNLDESNENNFAIYKENVQKIEIGNGKNQIVSEDADKYVIENADETVSNLKAGDFFAGTKEDGETVIAKVKSVTKDGTTVTIVQDDTGLDEVFDYVKIDTVSGLGNAQVDDSYCEEGVVYNGLVKPQSDVETYALIDDEASAEVKESFQLEDKKIKVGKNTITLSGGVELGIKASVKLYIALSKQSIELELAYGAELTASVDGKMDDQKIQLGKITITPVPGVFINFIPKVVFKFSANITLTGTLEGSVGLKYTNDDGIKNISKEPVFESELKIEGDFYAGLALEPEVVIISEKVAKAGVEAELGAQLHAEMTVNLIDTQSDSEKHTCKQCMNGYVYGKLKVTFSIKLFDDKKFSKEKSFDKKTEKQTFYYSITYNDFGLGKCPHVGEKVKQVCLGYDCNAVITENGDLYMWGDNNYAQLGNASYQDVYTPEKIMENVAQVSLGERHSAAITENGDLYMWGYNYYGQLGDGSKKNSIIPKKIMENVAQVSLGQYYSAAITKNGELYVWGSVCKGDGSVGTSRLNIPTNITSNIKPSGVSEAAVYTEK